jgi:hypothetical protein
MYQPKVAMVEVVVVAVMVVTADAVEMVDIFHSFSPTS